MPKIIGPSRLAKTRRLMTLLPVLARLGWRLARDERVPLRHRAVLVAAIGYALSPLDLAPDPLPLLGEIDDLLVVTAGLAWILRFAPSEVLEEHAAAVGITMSELQSALTTALPPPLRLAYANRRRLLPAAERGARRGAAAISNLGARLGVTGAR